MKENIIIVGDFNRADFLYVAKVISEHYNVYFLEYTHKGEVTSTEYKHWGKAIFWSDYKSAVDLLKYINPKMVLFYFIESFNHVALNVACKYKAVKSFHIEHGIRNYEIQETLNDKIYVQTKSLFSEKLNKLFNIRRLVKGRFFFRNTILALPAPYSTFLKHYFKVRSANNIFQTFRLIDNKLRIADAYISFSPRIFEFHQKSDHLPKGYPVYFTGIPGFDFLRELSKINKAGNNILFVDNACETQGLFGWNVTNKIIFLEKLVNFTTLQNRKLWIKPHPYSDESVYNSQKNNRNVELIRDEKKFKGAIMDSKVILGFYSTLLMPLMAMDHTVCFSLEMHPSATEKGLSSFLTASGALKKIGTWKELALSFENIDLISKEQKERKQQFIDDWLYKFDGKSTERLRAILLNAIS